MGRCATSRCRRRMARGRRSSAASSAASPWPVFFWRSPRRLCPSCFSRAAYPSERSGYIAQLQPRVAEATALRNRITGQAAGADVIAAAESKIGDRRASLGRRHRRAARQYLSDRLQSVPAQSQLDRPVRRSRPADRGDVLRSHDREPQLLRALSPRRRQARAACFRSAPSWRRKPPSRRP